MTRTTPRFSDLPPQERQRLRGLIEISGSWVSSYSPTGTSSPRSLGIGAFDWRMPNNDPRGTQQILEG